MLCVKGASFKSPIKTLILMATWNVAEHITQMLLLTILKLWSNSDI